MTQIDISQLKDLSRSRDKDALRKWISNANPGDGAVYHIGEHCAGLLKAQALTMAEGGLISLVQVRHDGKFAYVAIKHRKVKR